MLNSILKLLGLKKEYKKSNLTQDCEEKIVTSFEAFINRKIYHKLSVNDIDTIADENLIQAIFDNISVNLSNISENLHENVNKLNISKQAIYKIWMLEAEVNNGGFNQFYYNSSGQFYRELPECLKIVGAEKLAKLVKDANKTYEENFGFISKHQDGTLEGFSKSYNNNPLEEFDNNFYKLLSVENLQMLQINYIRNNKMHFIN